jgi:hypothetical protein
MTSWIRLRLAPALPVAKRGDFVVSPHNLPIMIFL